MNHFPNVRDMIHIFLCFYWKISEVYGKLINKIRKEGIIMNYLLVSPNFPTSQESFAKKLVEKGVRVIGIGSENYDNLTDGLKNSLTEYYKVNDLENYEEVLRGVAFSNIFYSSPLSNRYFSFNKSFFHFRFIFCKI